MFLQYELWHDCKFGCNFCTTRYIPRRRNKLKSLEYVKNSLKSKNIPEYSTIGFIGGEFFDGQLNTPEIKSSFYDLIDYTIKILGQTGRLMIATALMSKNESDVMEFCEFIHKYNYDKNTMICTSYDTHNRFKTDISKKIWENTFQHIQQKYPDVKRHVEMILTQGLVDTLLKDPLFLNKFSNKWNVNVHFNIPSVPPSYPRETVMTKEEFNTVCPNFFPKRKDVLTLMTMNTGIDWRALSDHRFHSTEIHFCLDDYQWLIAPKRDELSTTCLKFHCCHNCCGYIDSTIKIQNDIKMFLQSSL